MDTSKIKNYIIVLLVLVNVFLLGLNGVQASREATVRQAATKELIALYESQGISLPRGIDIFEAAPVGYVLTRDLTLEKKMVESVLGRCNTAEQSGNIYVYAGANGQASFRGTGDFEMLLNHNTVEASRGKLRAAEDVLKKMGITYVAYGEEIRDGEQYALTFNCEYRNGEVYNAQIRFLFSGDNLMMVSGKRIFDTRTSASETQSLDLGTALVGYLNEAAKQGYISTKVTGVSSGYTLSVNISGESVLNPVWRIETDTGSYMMNAVTGRFETLIY